MSNGMSSKAGLRHMSYHISPALLYMQTELRKDRKGAALTLIINLQKKSPKLKALDLKPLNLVPAAAVRLHIRGPL